MQTKKNFLSALCVLLCMLVLTPALCSCTEDEDTDNGSRDKASIIGTWNISKATVGYSIRIVNKDLKLNLDEETLNKIFGSTTFTFSDNGSLQVGDNYSCSYKVSDDVTLLTIYINEMTFSCHIDGLTDTKLSLSLTGQDVKDYILIYTTLEIDKISPDVNCKLVLTR